VSESDFHSKSKKTFIGHFNYYVVTKELYEKIKDEIPKHIGVYIHDSLIKKAKKQELGVDEQILKNSMIRSLYREFEKQYKSGVPTIVESLKRQINNIKKEADNYENKYWELMRIGQDKYGSRWYKEEKPLKG